jgi:enterochelin esterase-like enzyme
VFVRDYEEITDPLNPRKTTTVVMGKDMEIAFTGAEMEMSWLAMPRWKPPTHLGEPDDSRRGRLESQTLTSKHLHMKVPFDVYLPAGYDSGNDRYPVIYVHGGAAAPDRGRWLTTLDNLVGKRVAPVVVVFIKPALWGRDNEYAAMFGEELVPRVDRDFRTIKSPKARANVGFGFSGFTATNCTWTHPTLVGKLACQSPFLMDSMLAPLKPLIKTPRELPLTIYLDWGKYDLRSVGEGWDSVDSCRRFTELLRGKGYTIDGGEVHDGTGWSSWRNRTDALLETLFPAGARHETGG